MIPPVNTWAKNYKDELEASFVAANDKSEDEMYDLAAVLWGNYINNSVSNVYSSDSVSDELIGTGDASKVSFSGTLKYAPAKSGTVIVTAGSVTGTANGGGTISGAGIVSGTVVYATGAISVQFSTAPDTGVPVKVSYGCEIVEGPGISCQAPITPPVPLTGSTPGATSFAPSFKGKSTAVQIATELSNQFQSFAGGITWVPPPPAPPFTAITSVVTQAASVTAAKAILLAQLVPELTKLADPDNPDQKYTDLSNIFRTAFASLMVEFIGLGTGSPPPPLVIPVPVL